MRQDFNLLRELAVRYIWWKSPEEALVVPQRIVAQVMNIGDYEDVQRISDLLGDAYLRDVLRHAEAGQFDARSWAYWHYRLGLARAGAVPPMPRRTFE